MHSIWNRLKFCVEQSWLCKAIFEILKCFATVSLIAASLFFFFEAWCVSALKSFHVCMVFLNQKKQNLAFLTKISLYCLLSWMLSITVFDLVWVESASVSL